MENRNVLKQLIPLMLVVFGASLMRVVSHIPNVTPIAAIALFSGATLKGWRAYAIPFIAMLIADVIIGFHATMPFVYGSFVFTTFLGHRLKKYTSLRLFTITSISSVVFFIITNFGVWAMSGMYVKDSFGLMQSYIMGLPFLRNTLMGDICYTFSIFYGYAFLERIITSKYISRLVVKKV